ncbi:MAG: 4-(cytidine 5'-diphospho)-2-C-methyl-D-erythritol kinase [Eubacteriales bacterium]|nr:4-(cytidine 5'-diphospho)-2-C-methyl-D-erythritol kinase [Eubacteriales bacterium]MDY5015493.1 4-(cytidine 5'-diphospho)-2-C-methyl-D-erythritol kinase [Eubacteriales bacterium]
MTQTAPAKINLTLEVLGRRPDGYHELRMVMQSVSLCDTVTVTLGEPGGDIVLTTDSPLLPTDEKNLAFRAAKLFFDVLTLPPAGVTIHIAKRIPVTAGLAGGSTDAAAVLRALNELTGAHLPPERLAALSLPLGADVPFCVLGGTRLACGVGEVLTALSPLPPCAILLCTPDIPSPTGQVFARYDAAVPAVHPDTPAMLDAIAARNLERIASLLGNDLEPVVSAQHPEIASIQTVMRAHRALGTAMSGSGSSVFGIFRDRRSAEEALTVLKRQYANTFVTEAL